jgi:hypothetical protein
MPRLPFNQVVSPLLLRRFELEAVAEHNDDRHYALILRDDNDLVSHHPGSPQLDPAQMIWARDVLQALNRELHHDGAWVVCFTDPAPPQGQWHVLDMPTHWEYRRYCLIWLDKDGDPQFTMEWVAGENSGFLCWADVLLAGLHSTMEKAEGSWQIWKSMMVDVIEPGEGQTFKRAKGETPTSAVH